MKKNILKVLLIGALSFNVAQANDIFSGLFKEISYKEDNNKLRPEDIGLEVINVPFGHRFKDVIKNEFDENVYVFDKSFRFKMIGLGEVMAGLVNDKYLYIEGRSLFFTINSFKIAGSKNSYSSKPYKVFSYRGSYSSKVIFILKEEDIEIIKNSQKLNLILRNDRNNEVQKFKLKLKK